MPISYSTLSIFWAVFSPVFLSSQLTCLPVSNDFFGCPKMFQVSNRLKARPLRQLLPTSLERGLEDVPFQPWQTMTAWDIMRSIWEARKHLMPQFNTIERPFNTRVFNLCICYMSPRGLIILKFQRCKTYHGIVLQWSAWRLVELTQIISISTYRKMRSAKLTWFTSSGEL